MSLNEGGVVMNIMNSLERFLVTEIGADLGIKSLEPDEDLLEQRVIDSLGLLKLVTFIEESHGVQISDGDIVPENFQSLNSITKLVEDKMQNK
jgi:acyl carrier protein